jgi:hypothetical protein
MTGPAFLDLAAARCLLPPANAALDLKRFRFGTMGA